MILGRDRITIYSRGEDDTEHVSRTFCGRVITESIDGELKPATNALIPRCYYRLLLPRTLLDAPEPGGLISVEFGTRDGTRKGARFEGPITPIYDGRGRVHHYEVVVRT